MVDLNPDHSTTTTCESGDEYETEEEEEELVCEVGGGNDEAEDENEDKPATETDLLDDTNSTAVNCGGVIQRFKKRVF